MKLHIVYSVPEHCGHEVIDRIFTDLKKAREYCHKENMEWVKDKSYWDGSRRCFDIITKTPEETKNFDLDECDIHDYNCSCNPLKTYMTTEEYSQRWRDERINHNKKHSSKNLRSDCKFCQEDKIFYEKLENQFEQRLQGSVER